MKNSHIQWTDHTFNPWEGCTKVSPGCANCYAEARNSRFGGGSAPNWGKGAPRRRTSADNWREPRRWNAKVVEAFAIYNEELGQQLHISERLPAPERPRVFCASLADWLDEEVPIEWFVDLLVLIFDCQYLDWQLLTKRPENWQERTVEAAVWIREHATASERTDAISEWISNWQIGRHPSNVWVGTTVEDQARVDERVPWLLQIPAEVHFLSAEPLLEEITLGTVLWANEVCVNCGDGSMTGRCCDDRLLVSNPTVDWVIIGGESGPRARPFQIKWAEALIAELREEHVEVFVKQIGAKPINGDERLFPRHPKGGDPAEWPEALRVQEFLTILRLS